MAKYDNKESYICQLMCLNLVEGVIQMSSEKFVISSAGRSFQVYTNPSPTKLLEIGPLVRFTSDDKAQKLYVWDFNSGHHADVSIGLKFEDTFDSIDFLKGHAGRNDVGTYAMVGSDFLQSFFGTLAGKEKVFLRNLLNQDWNWVDDYIKVTGWIDSFMKRVGL
jgi:hypothetical protein